MIVTAACEAVADCNTNGVPDYSDIDNKVQGIDTLPEEAERPVVSKVLMRSHVLNVMVSGDIEEDVILPYPKLKEEEREMLETVIESVDSLLEGQDEKFREWDVAGEMPAEFIEKLKAFPQIGLKVIRAPQPHLVRDLFIGNYTVRYLIGSNEIVILRMWHGEEIEKDL